MLQRAAVMDGWDDETQPSIALPTRERPVQWAELRWCWPERAPRPTPLMIGSATVGRAEHCNIRFDHPQLSRVHAELVVKADQIWIRDLGSTNGTFVQQRKVAEMLLSPGDLVRIGPLLGRLELTTDPEPRGFRELAPGLLGGDTLARELDAAFRGARANIPIILCGDTGTGKERVAQALHARSGRTGRFVGLNCAALPDSLAESELFGYRQGAFTGAAAAHEGLFRAAHRGTLLLDEIEDLSARVQAKLLRVLEEGVIVPLGETRPVPIDVRVIAAVHQPLSMAVTEGRFRADLYARLAGFTVNIPSLRERPEDVPHLFAHFLTSALPQRPTLDAELVEQLLLREFPLNVRELRMLAQRTAALHPETTAFGSEHVAQPCQRETASSSIASDTNRLRRKAVARKLDLEALHAALAVHRNNLSRAAQAVGISRQRAYRLLEFEQRIQQKRTTSVGD